MLLEEKAFCRTLLLNSAYSKPIPSRRLGVGNSPVKELHIPFGIDRKSRQIVEPEDAERGRACNCLCPRCEAPLLSRHPKSDEKRIHFAHDSKHPEAKPIEDCPLSPYVALGMMLRHIGGNLASQSIKLTAYCKHINFDCCTAQEKSFFVTEDEEVVIVGAVGSPSIGGVSYDLKLTVNAKSYFVELIYPGKNKKDLPAPEHLLGVGGIFCISGPEFVEMMGKEEFLTARYSDSVAKFLLDHSQKFWAYHYLEAEKEEAFRLTHKCKPNYNRGRVVPNNANSTYQKQTSSYVPKYNTYNPVSIPAQHMQPGQQSRKEAAEAYLKASRGEGSTFGGGYADRKATAGYQEHEKHYLLPPSFHAQEENNAHSIISGTQVAADGINYECVFCKVDFVALDGAAPRCPQCQQHLGARLK